MNIQRFLRVCEDIEQVVSQIYRYWQQVFVNDASLSALWAKLADDELDHVRQVQLAQRVANDQVIDGGNISLESLEKALDRARQLLKDVKERDISSVTALRAAIKIEEEFSKAHLLNAANVTDESMAKMFKSLARADELHIKTLTDYCDAAFGQK